MKLLRRRNDVDEANHTGFDPLSGELIEAAFEKLGDGSFATGRHFADDELARLSPCRRTGGLIISERIQTRCALPPTLSPYPLVLDLAHETLLGQLTKVITRCAARLSESLAKPTRREASVDGQSVKNPHSQGMRERFQRFEIHGSPNTGYAGFLVSVHVCKDSIAKSSLQLHLCIDYFATISLQRGADGGPPDTNPGR